MMWWNHGFWGSGWGWPVFAIMAVAMVACMAMMARMMMRHGTSRPTWETSNRGQEPPEQTLARRLANGEIDVEEFNRLRDTLWRPGNPQQTRQNPVAPDRPRLPPDQGAF